MFTKTKSKCCRKFWSKPSIGERCHSCSTLVGVVRRVHHCRCCGEIFCSTCTAGRAPVMPLCRLNESHCSIDGNSTYSVKDKRVCRDCNIQLHSSALDGIPAEYLIGGPKGTHRPCPTIKPVVVGDFTGYLFRTGILAESWVRIECLDVVQGVETTTVADIQNYLQSKQRDPDCAICLEPLAQKVSEYRNEDNTRSCRHMFHHKCAVAWTASANADAASKCPTCRSGYHTIAEVTNPHSPVGERRPSYSPSGDYFTSGIDYFLADLTKMVSYRLPSNFIATPTVSGRRFKLSDFKDCVP
eukprot:TRINITY_DN4064_c1_g1_i1.p1 TRINITY_DN4064_c1_g1~~TRINITY_DN4064_c1_g1_i1.p1  ORF type:complete len:316 (+),score=51.11 TRINITY_DN4064_c1_g1_i1:52-948(+)